MDLAKAIMSLQGNQAPAAPAMSRPKVIAPPATPDPSFQGGEAEPAGRPGGQDMSEIMRMLQKLLGMSGEQPGGAPGDMEQPANPAVQLPSIYSPVK